MESVQLREREQNETPVVAVVVAAALVRGMAVDKGARP
jgi:hypothetical protein